MVWKYWKQVAALAWAETVTALRLNSASGFLIWTAGSFAVVIGLLFWGSPDAPRDEMVGRIFAALVVIGAVPFVFAWKFVKEPPRAYWQLRNWTKELETVILAARKSDDALMVLAEKQMAGAKLVRNRASIDELLAWERDLDANIKANFDTQFFLQVCGFDHPVVTYSSTYFGSEKISETRNISDEPADLARIDSKLGKLSSLLPYAGMHYRGKALQTIDSIVISIQLRGLPEHQSPLSTE